MASFTSAQKTKTIGYLGPSGTFTEQALLSQDDFKEYERRTFRSMPAVLNAVESGEIDLGFVAIENSIEGTVNPTIDTLAFSSKLQIQREVEMPIRMQLFGSDDTNLDAIEKVLSFPHALAQCRKWLKTHLPNAEPVAANSTAAAVKEVAEKSDPTVAGIGNELAGKLYGLNPIAQDIHDNHDNKTRFVTVASSGVPRITGHDKTMIVIFQRNDRPGSLLSILQEFSARAINLSKLESRPTKTTLGDYCFIIDLDGHISDEVVANALKNIIAKHADVKFLGSYPAAGTGAQNLRKEANDSWRSAEEWLETIRSQIHDRGE